MDAQKIKIELEVAPEIAMFLSLYLASTAQNDFTLQKALSQTGVKYIHDVAQSIMDQLSTKTDFDNLKLRSILSSLRNPDELKDIPSGLEDLLN
ncbi:MAG: hypothetical protein LWX56_03945 [Ignavibacteria bacterium]|nr:hypothetical protein [Ignavibacteria bacterium]